MIPEDLYHQLKVYHFHMIHRWEMRYSSFVNKNTNGKSIELIYKLKTTDKRSLIGFLYIFYGKVIKTVQREMTL